MTARISKVETFNYGPGGFHPVHINDEFKKGRYKVINKLGHGGFATVWLARDDVRKRYVALKILAERLSKGCPEVEMLRQLRNSENHDGKNFVMSMLDHFFIDGPNGNHLCVVSGVGGPSIKQFNECPGFKSGTRRLKGEVARRVALQATQGLAFIHTAGIVHGDFTAANILLQLANIDEWTIDDIHQRLGVPQIQELEKRPVDSVDKTSEPRYIVKDINMKLVDPKWLLNQIMIIDFGIAFLQSEGSSHIGTPKAYCAPEFLFESLRSIASDSWALGCTIFEIRTGSSLFQYGTKTPNRDQLLVAVVEMLGKLPAIWWDKWEKGREWYGNEIKEGGELAKTIQGTLHQNIMEIGVHDGDKSSPISKRVKTAFANKHVAEGSKATSSLPLEQSRESTESLVALVNQLTTDEAKELIAMVNKSSMSEEKSSSEPGEGADPAPGTSSGSDNKPHSGSGSGEATSGSVKDISSEGISIEGSSVSIPSKDKDTEPESDLRKQESRSPLTTVTEILEEEGTVITTAEGDIFEALLRSVLRLLPENRVSAAELVKHKWFTTQYRE